MVVKYCSSCLTFKTSLKCSVVLKIHWKRNPGACPHCATPCRKQCSVFVEMKQLRSCHLTCVNESSFLRNCSFNDQLKGGSLVTWEPSHAYAFRLHPYSMLHEHEARNLKWVFPPLVILVHLVLPHCVRQTVPLHWVCTSLPSASFFSPHRRASQEQPSRWRGHRGWL